MELITKEQAIKEFLSDGEVWVHTGDISDVPIFEYELDEDGDEIIDDAHRLMHPKHRDYGDSVDDLEGYNNHYLPT
jgi:hypothetical protein